MVHVDEYGSPSAPTLVILHGLFGSADNWRSQAKELSGRFHLLVPDLPHHGTSTHDSPLSIPGMARTLLEEMDLPETFYLLGHSLGGKIAMALALENPHRIRSVVVADIAPRRYPPRHTAIFEAMDAVAAERVENRSAADRLMEPFEKNRGVRAFLLKNLVPGDGGYRWRLNHRGLRDHYEEISDWPYREERYDGPVLVIRAENSPYVSDDDEALFRRHFDDCTVDTMTGVGHWLHAEDRETFLELVQRFLS